MGGARWGRHSCLPITQAKKTLPSELVEGTLAFDAVEFLGFPVDDLFDHFEVVGGGLEQNPLRAGTQIDRGAGAQRLAQLAESERRKQTNCGSR